MKEREGDTQFELFDKLQECTAEFFEDMRGMTLSEIENMPNDRAEETLEKLNKIVLTAKEAMNKIAENHNFID